MNLAGIVLVFGFLPKFTLRSTYPLGIIVSPVKPIRLPLWGLKSLDPNPILSNRLQNIMSAELPWSMKIRWTSKPFRLAATTNGSLSQIRSSGKSASEKDSTGLATTVTWEQESLTSRVLFLSSRPFKLAPPAMTWIIPLGGDSCARLGLRDLWRISARWSRFLGGDLGVCVRGDELRRQSRLSGDTRA